MSTAYVSLRGREFVADYLEGSLTPSPLALGYAAARRAAPDRLDLDDVAQEAAIRVAEVRERKPDASPAYLAGAARHRVLDLARGRPYTGSTSGRNAVDPLRRAETSSLDALAGDEESHHLAAADEELDRAEWSALTGEIAAAIDAIPCSTDTPKHVSRLVAAGFSASEAGRRLGLSAEGGRKAWALARVHLRKSLSHLEGALS